MDTWNLTHMVTVDRLIHELRERYGGGYNFEVVLSALEETLPFSEADMLHTPTATIRSVATLANWDPRVMRDVLEMVNHAVLVAIEESMARMDDSALASSRAFFDQLAHSFRIVHSDLNYDQCSAHSYRTGIADDGFRGLGFPKTFDPREFARSDARVLLMHLHGSALYRYRDGFIKVAETGSRTLPTAVERLDGLRYNAIISGTRKLEQFAVLPFLSYYQRFTNAILANPRLLIIGYGGGDVHLNTYLSLFREVHREDARVVWITRTLSIEEERRGARSLMAIYAGYRYQAEENVFLDAARPDDDGFVEIGNLLVGIRGFAPSATRAADRIVRHLSG